MQRLTHAGIRGLGAEGKTAEALLAAARMLEANPADLTAWHLLARGLDAAGRKAEAAEALTSLARAYDGAGDLPMAIVTALELDGTGGDSTELLDTLAAAYSAAAESLVDQWAMSPPPVPRTADADLAQADDAKTVEGALQTALALAESAADGKDQSPRRYFPILSALGPAPFVQLASVLEPIEARPGEVVVDQGDPGDAFFIVARGEVRVIRSQSGGEALLARLGPGSFFGEMSIVARAPRAARVEAHDHVTLLKASMPVLSPIAGDIPELGEVLTAFCRARMLENLVLASPVLARVPVAERPALFTRFAERTHPQGRKIITESAESDGLHLIVSGEVEISRDEEGDTLTLARLGPGDLFGEISLVLRRPATATVTAASETMTLVLPREAFLEVIHEQPALLSELYELALKREEETSSIMAREAVDADDLILV